MTMLFGSHFHPWLALARAGTLTEGTATNASTNMTTAVAQGKLHGVKDVPDMSAIMGCRVLRRALTAHLHAIP